MERRPLLAFVLGLLIIGVPFVAQSYMLGKQLSDLENQISLINQDLDVLWEEINTLKEGTGTNAMMNSTDDSMNFTFTWESDAQKIIQGRLRLEISLRWETSEFLYVVVKINDDDYNEWDYLGLVFDKNINRVIDLGVVDEPYGLWANNMSAPSALGQYGFLGFAEVPPNKGPHICTFNSDTGYTFKISFSKDELNLPNNSSRLHICFHDMDAPYPDKGVFIQFVYIPPVKDGA